MKYPILLVALILAGCQWFDAEPARPRAGVSQEQRLADFEACKEQARAMIARDQSIDQDITAASPSTEVGADVGTDQALAQNMAAFRATQRYDILVDRCMGEMGHAAGQY
jgi:hypothetical protein